MDRAIRDRLKRRLRLTTLNLKVSSITDPFTLFGKRSPDALTPIGKPLGTQLLRETVHTSSNKGKRLLTVQSALIDHSKLREVAGQVTDVTPDVLGH